jgi:hypothetical protein
MLYIARCTAMEITAPVQQLQGRRGGLSQPQAPATSAEAVTSSVDRIDARTPNATARDVDRQG